MNNNIIESIEWHRNQLGNLLSEDEFGKIESELDEVIEKFRLKGSKDKSKRKSKKGIKDIISDAFGDKSGRASIEGRNRGPEPGWKVTQTKDVTKPPEDAGEKLRSLKGASKRRRK